MTKAHLLQHLLRFSKFFLSTLLPAVIAILVLLVSIRGNTGSPDIDELRTLSWTDNGPFELSPERGRFALLYSVQEENSFQFSLPVAKFAAPDVALSNGSFVSMFAPGISLLILPGYILGKYFGAAQVGAYAIISLFGFLNFVLIRSVAQKLGAHRLAATTAGLLFLFASPSFPYAVSLYQHHISTFLILAALYTLLRWRNVKSLVIIWLLCGISIVIDSPNFFFMLPIGLYSLGRFITTEKVRSQIKVKIQALGIFTFLPIALPVALLLYINQLSYGNPFQLAGTNESGRQEITQLMEEVNLANIIPIEDTLDAVDEDESNEKREPRSAVAFFKTRNLPNGLYTHFLSIDRGMIMYTPIMFLGFLGLLLLQKQHLEMKQLLFTLIAVVALIYSMWGDPYGGWAFGSRYLIPAYALLSLGIALLLTRFQHNIFVLLLVVVLGGYSLFVNTVGALTTNRIPPKIQVLSLEELSGTRQRYTYTKGMEMLGENRSKSYVFKTVGYQYFTAWQFAIGIMSLVGISIGILLLGLLIDESTFKRKK